MIPPLNTRSPEPSGLDAARRRLHVIATRRANPRRQVRDRARRTACTGPLANLESGNERAAKLRPGAESEEKTPASHARGGKLRCGGETDQPPTSPEITSLNGSQRSPLNRGS
jgi:hypothetical protein